MKIENTKPGRIDGGYARIFNNEQLGALISRVHSTSISLGHELEKIILKKSEPFLVKTVEEMESLLLNGKEFDKEIYLIPKKLLKNKEFKEKFRFKSKHEPDFFIIKKRERKLYITELKDGDNFDTKKSAGEVEALREIKENINVPYTKFILVCCFNQNDKQRIIQGFKNKIGLEEAFTGQEFCELIGVGYQEILEERSKRHPEKHPKENLSFFCNELLKIEECRRIIEIILSK